MTKFQAFILRISFLAFCVFPISKIRAQRATELHTEQLAVEERQVFERIISTDPAAARSMASSNFHVNFYRCSWTIDPTVRYIKGSVSTLFTMTANGDNIVFDLSTILSVDSVIFHGAPINFQQQAGDGLQLQFPSALATGTRDSVAIYYHGTPRDLPSYKPFVLAYHAGVPILYTLSEPYGAKEWWPCRNALGDKADSIDIIITNPSGWQASANGAMVQEIDDGTNKTSIWKHRYPIASYLVAMAITNYTVIKDSVVIANRIMPLVDYAYPETAGYFNSQRTYTKQALALYGGFFGAYPFAREKYGFTQFAAGGGMEHQTNTFLNTPSGELISHETGHQWFGDKITCASWRDVWLNEGFATFCQVIYNQYIDTSLFVPILKNMTRDVTAKADGSVYVSDTSDPNRIFSSRLSYEKGAYLLHMLRWKLGDTTFFRGLRRYLNDPQLQYGFARTADLQRNLEAESGQDLNSFFQHWFYGEGYPNYQCSWTQNRNNWVQVQITQTTSHSSVPFYDMPVQLRFLSGNRDTFIVVNHTTPKQSFWVNPGFAVDSMSVDPKLWILAKDRIVQKLPATTLIQNDVRVYPVPVKDQLTIMLSNPASSHLNLMLYSSSGQLLYQSAKTLTGQDEKFTISTAALPKGVYLLCLSDAGNFRFARKILK